MVAESVASMVMACLSQDVSVNKVGTPVPK